MPKQEVPEFIDYAAKTLVLPDALVMAQKLIATGFTCVFNQECLADPSKAVSLIQFIRAFPKLGACMADWAGSNHLSSIGASDVLKALASDFHHQATAENIALYIARYQLDPDSKTSFFLYDLVIGGQIGLDQAGKPVLFYPSGGKKLVTFELREDQEIEPIEDHFTIVHLGRLVLDSGSDPSLTEEIQAVHRASKKVRGLLQQARGSIVKVFLPPEFTERANPS